MKDNNIKKSRKKRGMTLVEVIISIAVMAVLALMLTTIGVTIDKYRQNTKAVNRKIASEAPAAEIQDIDSGVGSAGKSVLVKEDFKINVNGVDVSGKLYTTTGDNGSADSNAHFKFVDIETTP